jgi:hypothetical protein
MTEKSACLYRENLMCDGVWYSSQSAGVGLKGCSLGQRESQRELVW